MTRASHWGLAAQRCVFLQNPGLSLEKGKQQRVEFEATLGSHILLWSTATSKRGQLARGALLLRTWVGWAVKKDLKKGGKKRRESDIPAAAYLRPSNWEGGAGRSRVGAARGCLCHLGDGWHPECCHSTTLPALLLRKCCS